MSLRRLHPHQPDSFAYTPANLDWAHSQIAKYPAGRQASAVIPLLWRAQEQEGWVTKPAIETVARMLDMAEIRVLEVATFYFMFQLAPVGSVAHIQVCGTTSCMICGAEDLVAVCKAKIAKSPHSLSPDGKFSWEEVECLGACTNAPMAQIGKDYYEDLTAEKLESLLDAFARGEVPQPGPQNGRWACEPVTGFTALTDAPTESANASRDLARRFGDTVARITGAPIARPAPIPDTAPRPPATGAHTDAKELHVDQAIGRPELGAVAEDLPHTEMTKQTAEAMPPLPEQPAMLQAPRNGTPDDLKVIRGIGPKLEQLLFGMGVYHFDQIAAWTAAELAWVDDNLEGFKGRATRDEWVAQARDLAGGK